MAKVNGPLKPHLIGHNSAGCHCFIPSIETYTVPYANALPSYLFGVGFLVYGPKPTMPPSKKKDTASKSREKKSEDGFELLAAKMDSLFFALHPNHKKASKSTSNGIAENAVKELSSSFKDNLCRERIITTITDPPIILPSHLTTSPVLVAPSLDSSRLLSTHTTRSLVSTLTETPSVAPIRLN